MALSEHSQLILEGLVDDWMTEHPDADEDQLQEAMDEVIMQRDELVHDLGSWVATAVLRRALKQRFNNLF
jgi:hypothetical protein